MTIGQGISAVDAADNRREKPSKARVFVIEGCDWTAREMRDPMTNSSRLVFWSAGVARRVRAFPSNWHDA
jgi:hypothetical protein